MELVFIEARDIPKGKADVIVCDGFTGNIVLKQIEAMYRLMIKRLGTGGTSS